MHKLKGIIVSDKMEKTRVVAVTRLKKHPRYKKIIKVTRRFKAHDEKNEYKEGEKVIIQGSKPISKDKCWVIIERIEEKQSKKSKEDKN